MVIRKKNKRLLNKFSYYFVFLFGIDYQNKGSLFTLFLTSPIFAFCFVCHLNDLTTNQWNLCQEHINKIMFEITKIFLKSKLVGKIKYFIHGKLFYLFFFIR